MGYLYLFSTQQQQPPFYGHYTGQPALASTSSYELEDFVGAKFYCLHALADGNQHIHSIMVSIYNGGMFCILLLPYNMTSYFDMGSKTGIVS